MPRTFDPNIIIAETRAYCDYNDVCSWFQAVLTDSLYGADQWLRKSTWFAQSRHTPYIKKTLQHEFVIAAAFKLDFTAKRDLT